MMRNFKRLLCLTLAAVIVTLSAAGCGGGSRDGEASAGLDPDNPVTITIWHYYNGVVMHAFETAVNTFNETVGAELGIIVEHIGLGSVNELEQTVIASANKEIGSMPMPNIFAAYADTAYRAEQLGLLADLETYFTEEEQGEYLDSFIEEGKIGLNGELRIFPVAKSTEVMILNDTDWQPFADEHGLTYGDLETMEGVARVSELYYNWTAAQSDEDGLGKAFFGRDGLANLFIVAFKEFGTEIFNVSNGKAVIDVNEDVMRKIWDYYYVPYISGYYYSYGRFRSDDAKVGDILAYVGSTASASYFPKEVTIGGTVRSVEGKVLPAPLFEGGDSVMVQQGAGMVVVKDTPETETASLEFLKWFTGTEQNVTFASLSGYMPVKKDALDYDLIKTQGTEAGVTFTTVTDDTLKVALEGITGSELYTNKAFTGGVEARAILENDLQDKAVSDRAEVLSMLESGADLTEAVSAFNTEERFAEWMEDITARLENAAALGQ